MCGIVGILDKQIDRQTMQFINNEMQHRGPDDQHCYFADGVALAACRLSIIDIAGGQQPLCNEDRTVWITYNGEVFNAPELREQLLAKGHQFRTNSDTEVIVHGYEAWGEAIASRLRGMFAFGIWDQRKQKLLVARDHFGMKPLYYAKHGGRFVFASEIRPILRAIPTFTRQLNPAALHALLRHGHIPTPLTAFKGIHQLPAAHTLVIKNGQMAIKRYWQIHFPPQGSALRLSKAEATEQFMARLRGVVKDWRMSEVPVGSLLSGGLDSSALAMLLTEVSGKPIDTFTLKFTAGSHDESAHARRVAQAIGSRHHELVFGSAEFNQLPSIIWQLEAPQSSMTSIAINLLYRTCHEAGFKVILTGEGADELLGGYHWFDGDRRVRPLLKLPRMIRQQLARLPLPISAAGKRVLAQGDQDFIKRYNLWQQTADLAQTAALLRVEHNQTALLETRLHDNCDPLHQFLALDSAGRMVDFINFEVDRMSMANSVEARPPFLDKDLWEWVAKVPPAYKLTSEGNKLLLRWGMQELLPDGIGMRPKQGLATPHAAWWREKPLPAWAEDALHPTALDESGYFNVQTVQALRQEQRVGSAENSRLLTAILTTQLWYDQFIKNM